MFLGQRILVLGQPPIGQARVIENPGAGTVDFRGQPSYWQRCTELREALGRR